MKIAYLVLAHKAPEQIIRLINRLNYKDTYFFIHIDKNASDSVYRPVYKEFKKCKNVFFIKRIKCAWADFSLVQATINGIKEVLNSGIDINYTILLSGQDYPIKTNEYIKTFLENKKGSCYIYNFSMPKPGWHNGLIHNIPKEYTLSSEIENLYGGSQWWGLTKECLEYIIDFIDKNKGYVDYCKKMFVPDEIFFHSIIMNSRYKDNVINDGLRYIDWDSMPPPKNHPATLSEKYFPILSASPHLFARKMDMEFDANIFELIDNNLLGD